MQVKDEVNAGNLLYKLGKVEFENVYFSYTNGLVDICFDSLVRNFKKLLTTCKKKCRYKTQYLHFCTVL